MNVEKKDRERESEASEQVVNPYKVSGKDGKEIDYDKLIDKFGCQRLDESLIDRVQRLTSLQPHEFLRRGVFFAHRDFNEILDAYERGVLSLHWERTVIGSFAFRAFNCFLVYQILARSFQGSSCYTANG
ncbi:unnamed protein product [Microthlaspi erraticum]|uniref:Tryptophanyl-tRNA synthetase n=1 Tax=Microthlaspi erraticum TaxID=1685480 RepID=A0A6D2II24_9BRAS|nr:unnamed protein product [Microthlaspi erraticum]